jgi:hypothetical protein
MSATYKVGGECDAWCTKCKRDTLHNIIALAAGNVRPARVECRSCHGMHNYAAPRSAPRAERPRADAKSRGTTAAATSAPKTPRAAAAAAAKLSASARDTEQRWEALVAANAAVVERPYATKAIFGPGDAIMHAQFGLGFVLERTGEQRIRVIFRDAERTLVTGYGL